MGCKLHRKSIRLAAFGAALTLVYTSVRAEEPFTVGVILPLTGEAAELAEGARNGITLALEKLEMEAPGKLRVRFEDDGMRPAATVTAFQKLSASGRLDALITWSSSTSKAVAELAENRQLPAIAIASDASISAGRRFVFNLWISPDSLTGLVLAEALRRGYRRVARVTTIHDGELSKKHSFDGANRERIAVVLDEELPFSERDFRSLIARLKHKEADAVLPNLLWGQLGVFARQLRAGGIQLPLFGYETFESRREVALSDGALVGAWFATADADTDFLARYEQRFPGKSLFTAANAHDGLLLFASARAQARSTSEICSYLRKVQEFKGATGVISASGDNRFVLPAALKVITAEGFERLR